MARMSSLLPGHLDLQSLQLHPQIGKHWTRLPRQELTWKPNVWLRVFPGSLHPSPFVRRFLGTNSEHAEGTGKVGF